MATIVSATELLDLPCPGDHTDTCQETVAKLYRVASQAAVVDWPGVFMEALEIEAKEEELVLETTTQQPGGFVYEVCHV